MELIVIVTCAGISTGLLLLVVFLFHRHRVIDFIYSLIGKPQFDYRRIFNEQLELFSAIEDCHDLYSKILSVTCKIVGATGASLIIRGGSDKFELCAVHGLASFSCDMDSMRDFLSWMEKKHAIVTREELVSSASFADAKNSGLKYCVQFNAEACVPLFLGEKLYGVLNMAERKAGRYDREACDVLHLLAVYFTSVIRRVELYQDLIRQNQALEQARQFRSHLLSNLSHELRTPLASIVGLSELLEEEEDGFLSDSQKNHVSMILEAGKRLLDSVNAIVDISKIEANHLELNIQKVNIRRLLGDIAVKIPFNKHTELFLNINDDAPSIYGDESRLRQVFWHLLDNAAKFTKRGKVSVAALKCGEMLKICIADTGIGIASDKQDLVLQGFYQADGGVSREHEGLGFGLTISRKIVELHGGRLWFASKFGYGSSFYLTLPLKPACSAEIALS